MPETEGLSTSELLQWLFSREAGLWASCPPPPPHSEPSAVGEPLVGCARSKGCGDLTWVFSRPHPRQDLLTDANLQLAELREAYPGDTHVCLEGHGADDPRAAEARGAAPFYWAGSGDFVLASRALVQHVRGYPQIAQNWQTDDLIHCRLRAAGAKQAGR